MTWSPHKVTLSTTSRFKSKYFLDIDMRVASRSGRLGSRRKRHLVPIG